jgi:hypothetical protein
MGDYKDKHGTTKVGDILRKIGKSDILEKAVGIVGNVASGNYLGAIQTLISKDPDITPEQVKQLDKAIAMDYADRANARAMQVAALSQDDLFSKRFIYYLAIGVFFFSASVVIMLFFVDIPEKNKDVINFILGIIVGTGLTGVFQYFFGSSKGSSEKFQALLNEKS